MGHRSSSIIQSESHVSKPVSRADRRHLGIRVDCYRFEIAHINDKVAVLSAEAVRDVAVASAVRDNLEAILRAKFHRTRDILSSLGEEDGVWLKSESTID